MDWTAHFAGGKVTDGRAASGLAYRAEGCAVETDATRRTGHEPLVLDPTARQRAAEEKILHAAEGPVLVDILGERAWAILPSFGAASDHPKHQGESAGRFDAPRPDKSHLAFGHRVHFCLGAPLARAEGATAVGGLFNRFPSVRLAVPAIELEPVSSILGNGHVSLPVHFDGTAR